jgi:hypothetical protein
MTMYVVKVCCGYDEPSITRPLRDIEQALRWIAAQAWQEFDGDAERAEIFELDEMNPQVALREVRAGSGRLVRTVQRPATPEQLRRAARVASDGVAGK